MLHARNNFYPIYHNIDIHHKTKFNKIDDEMKQKCNEFYMTYITSELDFLFVDHVSGLRASSVLGLFRKFKYIAYHDAEPKQYANYNYGSITKDITKQYVHILNPTPLVNTGILIHENYKDKIDSFISILQKNNKEYCKRYNIDYNKNIILI